MIRYNKIMNLMLMLLCIGVVSCKLNLKGELTAIENLNFNAKKKKYGPINLKEGVYKAKVTFKSKKKMYLSFEDEFSKTKKVLFKIPKGKKLPKVSGTLQLSSNESGQPYDLEGEIDTEFSSSRPTTTTESCSETFYERVCRRNRDGERVCYREERTLYGRREVTSHVDYTEKELRAELLDPVSKDILAKFYGTSFSSDRVVDYRGYCQVRRYDDGYPHY